MHDNFSIIMKTGHENEPATINNIKGIVVPMLDGRQFLILPEYGRRLKLLELSQIEHYNGTHYNECEALYNDRNEEETNGLAECGSPAATYVRALDMYLPSLQMCFAISHNLKRINETAALIKGAEQLEEGTYFWTSCRYDTSNAWFFYGNNGRAYVNYFYLGYTAVPVALL